MLMLCFTLGEERYALPSQCIEMVLPYVHWRSLPLAPTWLKGLMVYQGHGVPVIDLCQVAKGRDACQQLGTRMLLMAVKWQEQEKQVAFLVEHMIHTCRTSELHFEDSGVSMPQSPWLGQVAYDGEALLQILEPEAFLTDDVCAILFASDTQANHESVAQYGAEHVTAEGMV